MGDRLIAGKVARKDGFATTRNERYGTKTPEGNLKEIAVTLELSEQPEGMRPGGSVRAEIDSVLKADSVLVPLWAVQGERDGKGWSESPMLEPVRTSYFTGRPLEWRRVHALPHFVYFNHAVHDFLAEVARPDASFRREGGAGLRFLVEPSGSPLVASLVARI